MRDTTGSCEHGTGHILAMRLIYAQLMKPDKTCHKGCLGLANALSFDEMPVRRSGGDATAAWRDASQPGHPRFGRCIADQQLHDRLMADDERVYIVSSSPKGPPGKPRRSGFAQTESRSLVVRRNSWAAIVRAWETVDAAETRQGQVEAVLVA